MDTYDNPVRGTWKALCERPSSDNSAVTAAVKEIIDKVKAGGDDALRSLSKQFDGLDLPSLEVSSAEIEEAAATVSGSLKEAIEMACRNIRAFHSAQIPVPVKVSTMEGVSCFQKPVPINRVGLYIPGGTAPLFSTVLMLAIPAKLAGCGEVILCTPPMRGSGKVAPAVLYAASICGVDRIFKAGGAQAVAAMAFGTESIPRADKIFGPGNQYVTAAKQLLGGRSVAIDMPAGPSEVLVIADSTARPSFVAADLLSQAEHGKDSQVMLVCTDKAVADAVAAEVTRQTALLGRAGFIESSLTKSRTVILSGRDDIVDFVNSYAPEHLIISTDSPWEIADRIKAAGSIFIGNWSPESAGDYASGTNHTLPTCGWASAYSGVNMDSFFKKITIQELSREGLASLSETIVTMAENEGLQAHANAVKIRMNEK